MSETILDVKFQLKLFILPNSIFGVKELVSKMSNPPHF